MRRTLLVAISLLAVSCGGGSDRMTEPVAIPTSIGVDDPGNVGAGVCSLATGSGLGALVIEAVAGSPADGVFLPDDVIVEFDGSPIQTSSQLVQAVQSAAPGQAVDVTYTRDGIESTVAVTLEEASDQVDRAVLGVLVRTHEDLIVTSTAGDLTDTVDGALTRVASVNGQLWLVDPLGVSWAPLETDAPAGAFLPIDGEIYRVDVLDDGLTAILALVGGGQVVTDLDGWEAQTALSTLNDYLLLGASRVDSEGATKRAVLAVDPTTGELGPSWTIDPNLPSPVPAVAFRSPDGTRALVALAASEGAARPDGYVILGIEDGAPVALLPNGVPNGAFVFGWADNETLLTVESSFDEAVYVQPETGAAIRAELAAGDSTEWLWPVGDAVHVLADEGDTLVLVELLHGGRRPLTFGCTAPQLSEVGWVLP